VAGEINDLIRRASAYYPSVEQRQIRVILVEAQDRILPEFDKGLANFAAQRLRAAGVEVRTGVTVSGATPEEVRLKDQEPIPCRTLIWTTGVAPHPVIANSNLPKSGRGWIKVDAHMHVEGRPEVWALGDCAHIPNVLKPGTFEPALAQHAIREGPTLAHNIAAAIHGERTQPFRYRTMGQLATLGQHNGIGSIGPIRISGFLAWALWRTYYLWRLPRIEKRLRVATDWTVDLMFGRDISQIQTYAATKPGSYSDVVTDQEAANAQTATSGAPAGGKAPATAGGKQSKQ
jgi:NADH dehydrogenase